MAYADSTLTATLLEEGQIGGNANDEIVSEAPVDLSNVAETVPETTETVGDVEVALTQEIEFVALKNNVVVLKNTALPTVSVEIPNRAIVSAPASWNGELTTPTTISVTGTVDPTFVAPTTGILFGSPDVILVFDQAVTILLEGTTGQTAYKLPGEDIWNLIDGCLGTYANPTNPVFPNECSIGNGEDTKIITYHFTEFTELEEVVEETVEETTIKLSSGGSHSTGIRVSNATFYDEIKSSSALPVWLKQPVLWWNGSQITNQEFSSIMGWLIDENIIKIENKTKPEKQIIPIAPSTKHLFSLWEKDLLPESMIINLIQTYREYGVW